MDRSYTKKRIEEDEAYRQVLVDLERIVGNSCYNGNIQNYGPGGSWEGEGRWFRYPITFLDTFNQKDKRHGISADISSHKILSGYYAFGANRLSIIAALAEIIEYLEENHNLKI